MSNVLSFFENFISCCLTYGEIGVTMPACTADFSIVNRKKKHGVGGLASAAFLDIETLPLTETNLIKWNESQLETQHHVLRTHRFVRPVSALVKCHDKCPPLWIPCRT